MNILETLNTLNACHGPSGDEKEISEALTRLAAPFVDDCRTDTMGNLIAHKKGVGPRLMIAAHMDSIGFIITHIEKEGFLRFGKIGGLHAPSILHSPIRFKNGVKGLVSLDESADEKKMALDDLYLDIGAKDEAEAKKLAQLGDTAVLDAPAFLTGGKIVSPYLDNRISCTVLLMAMEQLKESPNDLYFVFTAQEELGLRGARTAAYAIEPDFAVAVDVTPAGDALGTKHGGSSVCGGGAAVKVMDGSVLCHPQMVERLAFLAERDSIPMQRDVIRSGGTDAGAIHLSRGGVITGGISIPCRYVHSPVEMADIGDVEACAKLVAAIASERL